MLEKVGGFIIKHKGAFLLATVILFAITLVGTVFLVKNESKINSDMVSYLSDDSDTKRGLVFLQDEFDIRGNATLVVRVDENSPEDVASFRTAVKNVSSMKSVSSVTWYGSISSYEQIDNGLNDILSALNSNRAYLETLANTLKEEGVFDNADKLLVLLGLADYYGADFVDTSSMESYLRHETSSPGVYDYVLIILTDIDSGNDAYSLLDDIKAEFGYTEYASSGTTETAKRLLSDTMEDLPWFIVCGVLSVLIILLLTSSSFVEPFILLTTLGVGIVISMGMNYLFPSISIISFAISAVLQLAITMDYAIFFMHVFRRNRAEFSPDVAAVKAFPEVSESILASGFTTVGGFAALYCMEFLIGTDIANVLIKGVIMSMVTVLILQPILTILADKAITRTSHSFISSFTDRYNASRAAKGKQPINIDKGAISRPVARFAVWQRIVLIVLAAALIVPCFLAQSKVEYSYLELYEKKQDTEEEILASELGNQLILAVPLSVKKTDATHKDFIREVRAADSERITGMLGVFTAVDIDEEILAALLDVMSEGNVRDIKDLQEYLSDVSYRSFLEKYGIFEEHIPLLTDLCEAFIGFGENVDFTMLGSFFRKVNGEWYTLYTISFNGNTEDAQAQKAYVKIIGLCSEYFGSDKYYPVGMITSSYEMSSITPRDFTVVTLVSIAIIYVIVTLLLRNPLKSLFIIVIIELGIWLNLAFNYLFGESINFIVYVIISSVQLGCTVDYAILFANTFEKKRSSYTSGKECAIATATDVIKPILTSALMIGSVCLGMYLISGNIVIKQLTGMLARGALISFVLVVFVQTAVWSFFKTEKRNGRYEEKLLALENAEKGVTASETAVDGEKFDGNGSGKKAPKPKKQKVKLSAEEKLALLEEKDKDNL